MFYFIINIIMFFFLLIIFLPLLNIVASSLSSKEAVISGKVMLWPVDFSLDGYKAVFESNKILSGYANTIFYTVCGTILDLALTLVAAYPLSRKDLPGKNILVLIFTFTMLFSGGMIPNYILMKNLHLINTRMCIIIGGALSVYNMIITMTYFRNSIPGELLEAAHIDGCSDFRYFISIVLPLSKAIIAVIALYYAVGHWNAYFNAMLYLNDNSKFPLTLILRDILLQNTQDASMVADAQSLQAKQNMAELLKYSLIIVASLPVWCVYPFVQKYFVEGVMIGSVKG